MNLEEKGERNKKEERKCETSKYLNHENTRHYRSFRKMTRKEVVVNCYILDSNS